MTLRKLLNHLKRPSSNFSRQTVDFWATVPENALVLDIGAKRKRGSYFGGPPSAARIITLDVEAGPNVDIVADAHDLHQFENDSVDGICCVSVLEHTFAPWVILSEFHRVLKPGGVVYVSVPFMYPYHDDPYDFYRFTFTGIVELFKPKFEVIKSGYNRGPCSVMAEIVPRFCGIVFSFGSDRMYAIMVELFGWLTFWIKYGDAIVGRYPKAYVLHTGTYCLGRKRP